MALSPYYIVMDSLHRYNELYDVMSTSGDIDKMRIFGEAGKWAFAGVLENAPALAEQWLARLEAVDWNNYLTDSEAGAVVAALIHRDGRRGPVWTAQQVRDAAAVAEVRTEYPPFYNFGALYATANMLASDHTESLSAVLPEEKVAPVVLAMTVEKLTDPDRRSFARSYFGL
jgi:hypothetical protein